MTAQPGPPPPCPGCESAMQVLFAGEVELDRCAFCGGLWFDRGELQTVSERPVDVQPREAFTSRRCAFCRTTLEAMRIGELQVECCTGCGGTYLDDGELAQLAGREVAFRGQVGLAAGGRRQAQIHFVCPGCLEQFDSDEGIVTSRGLCCHRCYGQVGCSQSVLLPATRPLVGDASVPLEVPVALRFLLRLATLFLPIR